MPSSTGIAALGPCLCRPWLRPALAAVPRKGPETANRLRVLANGYGLDGKGRAALAEMLAPRINSMYQLLARGSEMGAEPWRTLWSQGHGEAWLDDYEFTEERLERWRGALS